MSSCPSLHSAIKKDVLQPNNLRRKVAKLQGLKTCKMVMLVNLDRQKGTVNKISKTAIEIWISVAFAVKVIDCQRMAFIGNQTLFE